MADGKKITRETEFIIYGGGEVGNRCYGKLKEQGYHVFAALDRNKAGEGIVEGLYTWKLGTEPTAWDKKDCVVVICLANGMIHKNVADTLYESGYRYLIFLPMRHCIDDRKKRELTKGYNSVLTADSDMLEYTVINYDNYAVPELDAENSIIQRNGQHLTVWMRLELLFSESLELWQGDKGKMYTKDCYKDRNISCGNPCEGLFDYYAMRTGSYDIYFDSKKVHKSLEDKQKELDSREELYRLFKREYGKGMDFFIEGAPEVVWNPKNYCNLVGGHHRTLYLLHEGNNLFPVKMKLDDFHKWLHAGVFEELKQYICDNKIERFYAPLPHPCFLNFPASWEDTGRSKLADVLKYFSQCDISGMAVLDCGDDEGYFARNVERIGAKEALFVNPDLQQVTLACLFHRLLYRENVQVRQGCLESLVGGKRFDIVFALGNGGESEFSEKRLELLGKLCSKYLIMETTKEKEREKIQAYTGLCFRGCIHKEYKAGKIWELGVYRK